MILSMSVFLGCLQIFSEWLYSIPNQRQILHMWVGLKVSLYQSFGGLDVNWLSIIFFIEGNLVTKAFF